MFAKRYNLPIDHGALLVRENIPGDHAVVPGGAAEKAGLREHDIILTCNNEPLTEQKTMRICWKTPLRAITSRSPFCATAKKPIPIYN
ncbi:MAG: PDZ domain-containing protein [Candidatus Sungbacteria bacterium]|nr:PDZ domain-containing protein [Candidatus Sungbacteria bacterium]